MAETMAAKKADVTAVPKVDEKVDEKVAKWADAKASLMAGCSGISTVVRWVGD